MNCGKPLNETIYTLQVSQEKKEGKWGRELKEIMAEDFPNLGRDWDKFMKLISPQTDLGKEIYCKTYHNRTVENQG